MHAALICKGLKNRRWLSHDQNIYIPYYAAHIIGSYTMNMEEFAERAVQAVVIPPLVELFERKINLGGAESGGTSIRPFGYLCENFS